MAAGNRAVIGGLAGGDAGDAGVQVGSAGPVRPGSERHSVTGTTPGDSSGSPPNRPVTWVWVRAVTGVGVAAL